MKKYNFKYKEFIITIQYDNYSDTGILSNNVSVFLDTFPQIPIIFYFTKIKDPKKIKNHAIHIIDKEYEDE